MSIFHRSGDAIESRWQHETLRIEPWGRDGVRVRAAMARLPETDAGALTEAPDNGGGHRITIAARMARLVNGAITVELELPDDFVPFPTLRFLNTETGDELLAEEREHFWWPGARVFYGNRSGSAEIHQQFKAYDGEKLFGMGQRTHGRLDHKGLSLDLVQRNAEVSIPFVVSSRGYGFLWNNPAIGRVEFSDNVTRWTATQAPAIDYYIVAGTPAQVMERYADATGHAPKLPKWASGFWQSKLRYKNQDALMDVAREYRRRGLPLEVIVTDFFHWTAMGDYKLDAREYPDPDAMMAELAEMNVRLMVSIWPTISPLSENYERLRDEGLLVASDQGVEFNQSTRDKGMETAMPVAFYDPTNPHTREFIWDTVKRNYYDKGVRVWWLDACEPELNPGHAGNLAFYAGPGNAVAGIYPRDNARLFFEGMRRAAAETGRPEDAETVLLCRSAWAGQQKYAAAVWSGDIPATWEALRVQVRAGLSIAMAGIPWWTTDIGGFHGGDSREEWYRELMVRWFQYGAFCPLFRLHGHREPREDFGWAGSGGPNEVWSYGDTAEGMIRAVMEMRERMRPYIHQQLDIAAERGLPMMRPLFVDYPQDPQAWVVDDVFLFGSDVLVAPVLHPGVNSRRSYLPEGADWVHVWSGVQYEGGQTVEVDAPLHEIPVFVRVGADVPVAG